MLLVILLIDSKIPKNRYRESLILLNLYIVRYV